MGDVRFRPIYERVARAEDPAAAIRELPDDGVVAALAAASQGHEPLLANVLATEAQNRMARNRAALENLGEGVCSLDVHERIVYLNPAARRLLGWGEEDALGVPLHGAFQGAAAQGHPFGEAACPIAQAMRSRKVVRCETERFMRRGGGGFAVSYTAAPLLREGDVVGAVLVFSDITERKRVEAELRESEARWRALSDAAFEAIFVHDGERILDANRAAREIFGVRSVEECAPFLDYIAPSSRGRVLEAVRSASEDSYTAECRRTDGSLFWAEAMGRSIWYHGRPARVVALRELRDPPRNGG